MPADAREIIAAAAYESEWEGVLSDAGETERALAYQIADDILDALRGAGVVLGRAVSDEPWDDPYWENDGDGWPGPGAPSTLRTVDVRLPASVHARLRALSYERGVSINRIINDALKDAS